MKKQEIKPVAWLYQEPTNPYLNVHYDDVDLSQFPDDWFPVYVAPPASKPWIGLTATEIEEIGKPYQEKDRSIRAWGLFACAVEEKLKEKNT